MNIIETNWEWRCPLSKRGETKYIVLHHMASKNCSAAQIDKIHKACGWSGIGYHFFVSKSGKVYRGRPIWAVGAHAVGENYCSIGIGAEGDYSIEENMPNPQKKAISQLIYELKKTYPQADIVGHGEIGATQCPGKYYPLDELKNNTNLPDDEEDLTMSKYSELKQMIEDLKRENTSLRETISQKCGYYNYIDENMKKEFKPTVQKLVSRGKLKGNENGELMLTNDMMRILTILDRCGVFD